MQTNVDVQIKKKKTVPILKAHFKIFKLYNSVYWSVFVVPVNLIRAPNY